MCSEKEIYNLVNNHYKIPEFDVPDTYIGDTLSIIDRKASKINAILLFY